MKKILILVLLLPLVIYRPIAQTTNLEVLLIGTAHGYNGIEQDMSSIHKKILSFKPDAIFGEWLSPEDEKEIISYWNKDNVIARTKRLQGKRPIAEAELPATIATLRQKLTKNPKDYKARVDLAHAYYLNLDAGNGHFQMWQVSKEMKRAPANAELFEYARLVLHPSIDSVYKFVNNYADSEYDLIAYPMLMALGHEQIWPMDSQGFDPFWSEAWSYSDSLATLYERQMMESPNSAEALQYRAIKEKEKNLKKIKDEKAAGPNKHSYTELVNSAFIDDFYFRMNIVSTELLALRGFPAAAFQEKLHWWMMRNISMCENTVKRSKANGFKKVVVVVGAGHRYPMATLFSQMPDVKIWNILDYKE